MQYYQTLESNRRIVEMRSSSALECVRKTLEGQEERSAPVTEWADHPSPSVRKLALSVHELRSRFKERCLPEAQHLAWPDCRHGSGSVEALALGR